jgi:hypothetical protein
MESGASHHEVRPEGYRDERGNMLRKGQTGAVLWSLINIDQQQCLLNSIIITKKYPPSRDRGQ